MFQRGFIQVYYLIPNEVAAKFTNAKKIAFITTTDGDKEPLPYILNDDNIAELRRLPGLQYNDYLNDDKVNPRQG